MRNAQVLTTNHQPPTPNPNIPHKQLGRGNRRALLADTHTQGIDQSLRIRVRVVVAVVVVGRTENGEEGIYLHVTGFEPLTEHVPDKFSFRNRGLVRLEQRSFELAIEDFIETFLAP